MEDIDLDSLFPEEPDVTVEELYDDEEYICPDCNGSGEGQYERTVCAYCNGRGTMTCDPS